MRDLIQELKLFRILKDDLSQPVSPQHAVFHRPGESGLQLCDQAFGVSEQLMIHRITVQKQSAVVFQFLQGRGLAAAAAAGDADDGHAGDQGIHDLLCRQRTLPENPVRRFAEIQHR